MTKTIEVSMDKMFKLLDVNKRCDTCSYFSEQIELQGKPGYVCKLTNSVMKNNYACGLHNVDISEEHICYNCKNYIGGGDFGLSCSADYYALPHAFTSACGKFQSKKELQTMPNNEKKYTVDDLRCAINNLTAQYESGLDKDKSLEIAIYFLEVALKASVDYYAQQEDGNDKRRCEKIDIDRG